ncbi:hypothetical protein PLESTM_001793100 [Pleodorina starrii]|nr:hypothetical protein PLESTM_001793100 [Pleodorina starrii]
MLLKGIYGNYSRKASASPFIIWSPSGFPVALGADGDFPLPVVVAVDLPSGSKLVAFGHEAIPNSCCSSNDDWDRLTLNAVRWMAGGKTSIRMATPRTNWAADTLPSVKMALGPNLTVTTSFMDLDSFAAAGGSDMVDIYWIDTYIEYTSAQVAALLRFANQTGKGLLVAGHIWYWGYSHPGANIFTDRPINQVLWPLGLAVTPDVQTGFTRAPFKLPLPSTPVYNSFYLASLLAHTKATGRMFNQKSLFPAANAALKLLLKWLPRRSAAAASAAGLEAVWALLDTARSGGSAAASPTVPLSPAIGYPSKVLDAYPGLLPAGSSSSASTNARGTVSVTIDGNYARQPSKYNLTYGGWDEPVWRSTGLYAPPGYLISVTLGTAAAVGKGLQVQIGAHIDDLTSRDSWKRVPIAFTRFALNATVTTAGNPLGGLVFVLVPPGSKLGSVQITISNVVRAPYFKLGTSDKDAWAKTIESPTAPWAELDSGKLVLALPSKAVNSLPDPVPLLRFWNDVMDKVAYLANLPAERVRPERLVLDADTEGGWVHSGYPMVMYDTTASQKTVTELQHLQAKGAWWVYHLLGNNHLREDLLFPGSVEALNNLFTIYVLEQTGVPPSAWENWAYVSPEGRAAKLTEYMSYGAHRETDWWGYTALDTFLQLKEGFGWEFHRKVFAAYQSSPPQGDAVQAWIRITSQVAGVNLTPFYRAWSFPLAAETLDSLASLPAWTANPFLTYWSAQQRGGR